MARALVITEKPSVARDIAAALGGFREKDGWWESADYLVTFAVGHLFELLEPDEIDEKFKRWTLDILPIIPERFELKKKKGQSDRIRTISKLLKRADVETVVNGCDAGREGELIFREVMDFLGVKKPVQRLWLQSMTAEAIRRGFETLRPGRDLEGLGRAAECRAYSDWLIGMNATRALTKRLKSRKERGAWSAGRVQTPTLALLVDREFEVLAHTPETFYRVTASFRAGEQSYEGVWFDPDFKAGANDQRRDDRIFNIEQARQIVEAVRGQNGLASEERKPSKEAAPPLFDLTSLQRTANSRFGWSARRTLASAQRCYEGHKLLTYPRTDSRCLPSDYRGTVNEVLRKLSASRGATSGDYARAAARLLGSGLENTGRIFNDAGVSDHFAIVPTGKLARGLSGDDQRLFDLVMRRFLGAFHPPALWENVKRNTLVSGHNFRTRSRSLMAPGWRAVLPDSEAAPAPPLARLAPRQDAAESAEARGEAPATTERADLEEHETKPPPRIGEARLLSLMENAGQSVEDEDLAAVLHEKGLGTPATRAEVIENLIRKEYALRQGKSLRPTVKGIRLIDTLRRIQINRLTSAALTGEMEERLRKVEQDATRAGDFMGEMKDYTREIVERTRNFEYEELYADTPALGPCPACNRPVFERAWFYRCEEQPGVSREDDCPMRFWKDTAGRYLDRGAVGALLRDGRSGTLDSFATRNGRTYKGHLEIDREEWKLRVVSEGDSGETIADPEYEVNEEPLGPCPFVKKDCQVIETPTHFICTTRLHADQAQAAFSAARRQARERGEPAPEKPAKPDHPGFLFPRTVCKREITRDEALVYLQNKRSDLLEDFTSRYGRPFSATLVLQESGRHGFEFPPRKKTPAAARKRGAAPQKPGKKPAAKPLRSTARRKKAAAAKSPRKKAARKKTTAGSARKKTAAPRRKPARSPARKRGS